MYKARKDFICAVLGEFKKDEKVEDSERAEVLFKLKYLVKIEEPEPEPEPEIKKKTKKQPKK